MLLLKSLCHSAETDEKNRLEGNDTSVDRTRRLFCVTCSRAQQRLAVIVYTKVTGKVASYVSSHSWFDDEEIVRM